MDVFPICDIGMMVANTYEIKPFDSNLLRLAFEQMYGMHIGMGKLPYRSKDSHTQIAILHTR
jgi:hypothetical protein